MQIPGPPLSFACDQPAGEWRTGHSEKEEEVSADVGTQHKMTDFKDAIGKAFDRSRKTKATIASNRG